MMTVVELRESALVRQIEQLAEQTAEPVEKVLATAVETYLEQLERYGIRAETQAFWAMQDGLLAQYPVSTSPSTTGTWLITTRTRHASSFG